MLRTHLFSSSWFYTLFCSNKFVAGGFKHELQLHCLFLSHWHGGRGLWHLGISSEASPLLAEKIPGELIWPSLPFYLSSSLCMVFLYLDRLWLSSSSWTSKYLTRETFALEKKCLRICLMWFFSRLTRYSYMMEQWAWTGNIYSCFNLILNIFSSTASPAILFLHTSWFCHLLCKIISFRGLLWRLKILQNVVFLFGG